MFFCVFIMRRFYGFLAFASLPALLLLGGLTAKAFETDNYRLPLDTNLADLGPFLEAAHTIALEKAIADVNARIEKALQVKNASVRAARLEKLHSPEALLEALMPNFGHPLFEDTQLERSLHKKWARQSHPGQVSSHQDVGMYMSAYSVLDLRRLMVLTQARTVKAWGVYFGTDKVVHFHTLGLDYYQMYHALLRRGLSHEEACQEVYAHYTARAVFSEKSLFGSLLTGVYSNADLAANLSGFKFLLNLTEKVSLKGEEREPLVVRCGVFWRLNRHVRLRSGWFAPFISDHWNEALNPNRYDAALRPGVRRYMRDHADHIVQFYTEKDGRPNDPGYFDNLARELSTYYGEPYGHSGEADILMTIGNTCIPAVLESSTKAATE